MSRLIEGVRYEGHQFIYIINAYRYILTIKTSMKSACSLMNKNVRVNGNRSEYICTYICNYIYVCIYSKNGTL